VTGATGGLGGAAVEGLAAAGATVELLVRDQGRGEDAAEEVAKATGAAKPTVRIVDIADLDSVRHVVEELRAAHEKIDVLIHNAGAMFDKRKENSEGIEMTWALMVLGPFLMTELLADRLADGRVIWVTSGGMYTQRLHLDDLEFEHEEFDGTIAYARCKRAQVDLVAESVRRGVPTPTTISVAMHPGWADTPGVEESLPTFHKVMGPVLRDAEQGADTMVWLAGTNDPIENGSLYFDRRPRTDWRLPKTATSDADRARLWDTVTAQLAGA
jgi:NAD(P)-dependent dehydrogenase (short-subunit alcohol dehydrogenase family)